MNKYRTQPINKKKIILCALNRIYIRKRKMLHDSYCDKQQHLYQATNTKNKLI